MNFQVSIKPSEIKDKRKIYDWLANSNITKEMLGPPKFPDIPIPSWEEFDKDYNEIFFDINRPYEGQSFIIKLCEEEVGQINYGEIDLETNSTEIDIWLADKKFTGKGIGTKAIKLLIEYLNNNFNIKTFFIAPSKRNENAIKAYKKAGFTESNFIPKYFIADCDDAIVLIKNI